MLAKIFHHIVSLILTMNQNIKAYFFLEFNAIRNLIFIKLYILFLCYFALSK